MSQQFSATQKQPGRAAARNGPENVDPIAEGLRQLYRNVTEEAVPDEFIDLLNRIDLAAADLPKEGQ